MLYFVLSLFLLPASSLWVEIFNFKVRVSYSHIMLSQVDRVHNKTPPSSASNLYIYMEISNNVTIAFGIYISLFVRIMTNVLTTWHNL